MRKNLYKYNIRYKIIIIFAGGFIIDASRPILRASIDQTVKVRNRKAYKK